MVVTSSLTNDELLRAIYRAAGEYEKLAGKSYLIIGKDRHSPYFWFQCHFEEKQFMHLLGIKSRTMSADGFYKSCIEYNKGIGSGITITNCTPSHNHSRITVNEKCSCCADMLKIQDAKYMKVGLKDKISQYVDFCYAYGSEAVLGFQRNHNSSFPITLIPQNIGNFSTKKYRVVLVLESKMKGMQYDVPIFEIKSGFLSEQYSEFPEELQKLIKNPT